MIPKIKNFLQLVLTILLLLSISINFKTTLKVEAINPNLKYFGYYNSQEFPLTPDGFADIKQLGNSNITYWDFGSLIYNDQRALNLYTLDKARAANLKLIAGIGNDPFLLAYGQKDTTKGFTFSDQEFDFYFSALENVLQGYEDNIYSLYFDEPAWRGYKKDRFIDLTARLKKRFPNYKLMAIEAYPSVIPETTLPNATIIDTEYIQNLTDIGYDYYPYYPSKSYSPSFKGITLNYVNKLNSITTNSQKIWLVPDATLETNCNSGSAFLVNAIEDYYDIAQNNPKIVGMLPYLYGGSLSVSNYITSKRLFDSADACYNSNLKQKHISIGKSIASNIDIIAPTKPIITSLVGGSTQYTLTGTSEGDSVVKLFDQFGVQYCQVITNSSGLYSCPFTVTSGSVNKFKMFATDSTGNNSQLVRFGVNGNCSYSQLPIVGADSNNWADKLNDNICQSIIIDNSSNAGKLHSDLGSLTDTGKVGIGTNNPSTPLAIVGLNEYASEIAAKTAGLKNGDLYRTDTQVKVVVGGDNIVEKPEIVNSDCGDNNIPNRLPIVGSDSNNWASILNHFLCNTMSNESGSEGKLKTNLANISADGKVGIGTIPVGVANFAVKGLPNYTNLSTANNAGSKNGDIYQTNGSLQVVNSSLSSNITIANSDDCYQSTATTRLPKPGQDATTWGDILNNFLCRSHLNGVNNAGKLKTDLATIVQGGKIGIGTNNPTSVLAIPNLPEFTNNQQAGLNIQVGSFYRTGNDVKIVY